MGWPYPKHLAGRSYSIVVHGDSAGTETLRRCLSDWLNDMHLIEAGAGACIDRYIDYYGPYATSHDALDNDGCVARGSAERGTRFERPSRATTCGTSGTR